MHTDSGKTRSCWFATVEMPQFPALDRDAQADVCVVGAGLAGVTAAFLLSQEGKKVVVIDDGPIVAGETGRTTAHITSALDDRYYELERLHGAKGIELAAESHNAAINKIDEIVQREAISCGFARVDGFLYEPPGGDPKSLQQEHEACLRAGLPVEMVIRAPAPFDTGPALRFPRQAQFHPLKYLRGLVEVSQRAGVEFHNGTRAEEVSGESSPSVRTAEGQTIRASQIVVATNSPINDRVVIHSKQAPYRTYVVGLKVPKDAIVPILLWDDAMPYHYVRLMRSSEPASDEDILIVGGEDHKTGQHEDLHAPFGRLERWTRERYPMSGEVAFRWSGQVMEPFDGIGFIGRNPGEQNVFVITGDSGNGITHTTLGAMLVTDLIAGRPNRWESLYEPARKKVKGGTEYVRENVNVALQYRDYLARGDASSSDEIAKGSGAVLRRGLKLVAAFRDDQGVLHERSAVCPHLGCVVRWNHVERTWDCPCHGSRFDGLGKVLNGPSPVNLEKL